METRRISTSPYLSMPSCEASFPIELGLGLPKALDAIVSYEPHECHHLKIALCALGFAFEFHIQSLLLHVAYFQSVYVVIKFTEMNLVVTMASLGELHCFLRLSSFRCVLFLAP